MLLQIFSFMFKEKLFILPQKSVFANRGWGAPRLFRAGALHKLDPKCDFKSRFLLRMNNFYFISKIALIIALFFAFALSSVKAEVHTFGGKVGWSEINVRNGITTGKGRFGYESLELETNSNVADENTDCLIDFENGKLYDKTGKYKVIKNKTSFSKKSIMGKGSALSRAKGGIELEGSENSLFGGQAIAGSFSIDFWICPSSVENGEVLLNWRSSKNIAGQVVYQLISTSFYKNKVMTIFSNIFEGYEENRGDVTISSLRTIIPNQWSHHLISYEEETGILEYRINGQLEDIKYLTDSGHEGGTVMPAVLGVKANLDIVPNYMGLIDDFRILRSFTDLKEEENSENSIVGLPAHYKISGGRFESVPVLLKQGTIINKVTAEVSEPSQTDVKLYIRTGDNYFNWTEDFPEWKSVKSGENIENLSGLYFQIAGELFPDGGGKTSPSVTEIQVEYTMLPEPFPPYRISVETGDGQVTLTWSYSVDDTAGGYYIYYGNRPGEYLGRVAKEGVSPINVGNVTSKTLTGLKNGTIYYFAVAAYSKIDERVCGPLSKEVYARPERSK